MDWTRDKLEIGLAYWNKHTPVIFRDRFEKILYKINTPYGRDLNALGKEWEELKKEINDWCKERKF